MRGGGSLSISAEVESRCTMLSACYVNVSLIGHEEAPMTCCVAVHMALLMLLMPPFY
jgi:hypothetical protein